MPLFNPAGMRLLETNVFKADGTWTRNPNADLLLVDVIAGGGGGASADASFGASGGGGGARVCEFILARDVGATESVTVGAQANAGVAGNLSAFGSTPTPHLAAYGGGQGRLGTTGSPDSGGGGGGLQTAGGVGQDNASSAGGQPSNAVGNV